jgi:hypothetical protein
MVVLPILWYSLFNLEQFKKIIKFYILISLNVMLKNTPGTRPRLSASSRPVRTPAPALYNRVNPLLNALSLNDG